MSKFEKPRLESPVRKKKNRAGARRDKSVVALTDKRAPSFGRGPPRDIPRADGGHRRARACPTTTVRGCVTTTAATASFEPVVVPRAVRRRRGEPVDYVRSRSVSQAVVPSPRRHGFYKYNNRNNNITNDRIPRPLRCTRLITSCSGNLVTYTRPQLERFRTLPAGLFENRPFCSAGFRGNEMYSVYFPPPRVRG